MKAYVCAAVRSVSTPATTGSMIQCSGCGGAILESEASIVGRFFLCLGCTAAEAGLTRAEVAQTHCDRCNKPLVAADGRKNWALCDDCDPDHIKALEAVALEVYGEPYAQMTGWLQNAVQNEVEGRRHGGEGAMGGAS